jgi:hypothetical protein
MAADEPTTASLFQQMMLMHGTFTATIERLEMRLAALSTASAPDPAVPPPAPPPTASPLTGPSVSMPFPRIPKLTMFAGNERDLEPWLSQAHAIIDVTPGLSLTDFTCVAYAQLFLEKKARTVWDHRVRETNNKHALCTNWEDLCALLRKLLGPANTDITGRAQLRTLRQTSSVQNYTDVYLRIVRSMDTPMQDIDLRESYIGGLKPGVQQHVRQKEPTTFHDAQTAASLYDKTIFGLYKKGSSSDHAPMELGSASTSRHSRPHRPPSRPAPSRSPSPHARRSSTPARPQRSPSPGPRLCALTAEERARCIKDGLCFRCRQPGHMTSDCPKSAGQQRSKTPFRKN